MMWNLHRITRLGRRLINGQGTVEGQAYEVMCLCEAEDEEKPAAIHLPGEMDRIIGLAPVNTQANESRRVAGGVVHHVATLAYSLRNTALYDGHLYSGALKIPLGHQPERWRSDVPLQSFEHATLCSSMNADRYFGHWLMDSVPSTMAAMQLGTAVIVDRPISPHTRDYSGLFQLSTVPVKVGHFKQLNVLEDFSQNSYKRQRYQRMRDTLWNEKPAPDTDCLMFVRGSSGVDRQFVNEPAVAEFLAHRGVRIIHPMNLSVDELIRFSLNARVAIGVEGSHLIHSLLTLRPGGTLLILQPPYRFSTILKDYTDALDLRFAFVLGEPSGSGFVIDTDRLARTLDLLPT
jgi:capsular polysaccharide biosynthesis protein